MAPGAATHLMKVGIWMESGMRGGNWWTFVLATRRFQVVGKTTEEGNGLFFSSFISRRQKRKTRPYRDME